MSAPLEGVYVINLDVLEDERGFFARTYCYDEFTKFGCNPKIMQSNLSFNHKKGTLRGMHFQKAPKEEAKLVRCVSGSIYDVIIDLRPDSSTYKEQFSIELSATNRKMLYVPEGFAHGFQTLMDNTEILYQMTEFYSHEHGSGIKYNDPVFNITWPMEVSVISLKDQNYPDFI